MVSRFGGDEFCVLFQPSKKLVDADLDMIAHMRKKIPGVIKSLGKYGRR
jgi:GGDEF domain-containing protein